MVTIYFDQKPLYLTESITPQIEEYLHHEETVFIDELNSHTVKAMIHEMHSPKIQRGVFLNNNVQASLDAFRKKFHFIIAAGGFVYTEEHRLLLIYRKGKWDLPKGKLDGKESLESCALREIEEETGIKPQQSEGALTVTYHTYQQEGKWYLKESHWFMVKAKEGVFTPQTDEDIMKCEWVDVRNIATYLENTHASIIDVVNAGIRRLHEVKNI